MISKNFRENVNGAVRLYPWMCTQMVRERIMYESEQRAERN